LPVADELDAQTGAHDGDGSNARFVSADTADVLSPSQASLLIQVAKRGINSGAKKTANGA
jgi:hypothetical protein